MTSRLFVRLLGCWAVLGTVSAGNTILIPHVVSGRDFRNDIQQGTSLTLINHSDQFVRLEWVLTRDDGTPMNAFFCGTPIPFTYCETDVLNDYLAPFEVWDLQTSRYVDEPLSTGWGVLTLRDTMDRPVDSQLVTAHVTYGTRTRDENLLDLHHYSVHPTTTAFATVARIRSFQFLSGKRATWITLLNPSPDQTARVRLRLFTPNRSRFEKMVDIVPLGKLTDFLDGPRLFAGVEDFSGSLDVDSTVPLAVYAMEMDTDFYLGPDGKTFAAELPILPPRDLPMESPYLQADPNPIQICDGSLGVTTIIWTPPIFTPIEVRLGAPDGKLFARGRLSGSQTTGPWVRNGTTFYLVTDYGATIASLTIRTTTEGCPEN